MSLGNNALTEDTYLTSHVPQDEGQERARIISTATGRAIKHENNERHDPDSVRSPSAGYKTEYQAYIPNLPKKVPLSYRGDVSSFYAIQEWEGYVTGIEEDTFEAELVDLTDKEQTAQEKAVFDKAEISSGLDLLDKGAVFRWSIGYETRPGGMRQRVSRIVFRRMPAWKKSDLEHAEEKAKSIKENIQWD